MSESLSEIVRRAARRKSAVAVGFLLCLLGAGCAQRDTSSEKDQQGGFYGGLSAGKGM